MTKLLRSLLAFFALSSDRVYCRHIASKALSLSRSNSAGSEILLAAEDATLFDSSIQSNHDGYTGNGYIDFGEVGSYAVWSVNVPITGSYQLCIRYASSAGRGPMLVLVGGKKIGEFAIRRTNSWTNWMTETITISLSTGKRQELKLLADRIDGPNVDKITLKSLDTTSNPNSNFKVILAPNQSLERNQFVACEAGKYLVGMSSNGDLVVLDKSSSTVLWSLGESINKKVGGNNIYMQNDGNLVIRASTKRVVWDSKTYRNPGSYFVINDAGVIAVIKSLDNHQELWRGGPENPIAPPKPTPSSPPKPTPTAATRSKSTSGDSGDFPATTILKGNENFGRGQFAESPNNRFKVGLNSQGNLIMLDGNKEVWRLQDKNRRDITNIDKASMQKDGNLVLRESSGKLRWDSETSNNNGSEFQVDDGGQLKVVYRGTVLWMDGIPRQIYRGPSSPDLTFPVRGMFYYAWYVFALTTEIRLLQWNR
jgi:hypothetical protein